MINSVWKTALNRPHSRKAVLVSLLPAVPTQSLLTHHPAIEAGCLRYATSPVSITNGSKRFPFWPILSAWPEVEYSFSPEERRAEIPSVNVVLFQNTELENILSRFVARQSLYARVDLWCEGIDTVDELQPLLIGPVSDYQFDEQNGTISLTVTDGNSTKDFKVPNAGDKLSVADFPKLPPLFNNVIPKQYVFGEFRYPIPCWPIDGTGNEFYVCHHRLEAAPQDFYVAGRKLTKNRPTIKTASLPSDPASIFTKLFFPFPVQQSTFMGSVSCGGGYGVDTSNILYTIISDICQFPVSQSAKSLLNRFRYNMTFLMNNNSSIYDLVFERILPQTPLIPTFRNGEIFLFDLLGPTPEASLDLGGGLLSRIYSNDRESSRSSIYNAIEVGFSRTIKDIMSMSLNPFAPQYILVDSNSGGQVGKLLSTSESMYGRQHLKIQAQDIGDDTSAFQFASLLARNHAMIHRRYSYLTRWDIGLSWDLNYVAYLTDDDMGLSSTKTRVVNKKITAAGPILEFQTEDSSII